jgi:hypothetical protein
MGEDVVLGGTRLSWLQNLPDAEILQWPDIPPSFPEDVTVVRDRIRGQLGCVAVPPAWDNAHSEIRRLLRTDAGRLERQRRTSVMFPWEAPRFDSTLGQRQLRILNAIFLGIVPAGGRGQVGGGDRLVSVQTRATAASKARLDNLIGMATDYRQAQVIRLFVGAMRRRSLDADGALARKEFEVWCNWALAEADELDPTKSFPKSIEAKHEK